MLQPAAGAGTRRRPSPLRVETLETREAPAFAALGWEWSSEEPNAPDVVFTNVGDSRQLADSTDEPEVVNATGAAPPVADSSTPGEADGSDTTAVTSPAATDAAEVEIGVGRGGGVRQLSGGSSNAEPVITGFVHVMGVGGICTFSGQVTDETPGGLTIRFGGEPDSLQGVTAVTDSTGAFSKTVQLQTNGTDTGNAEVQTTDPQGLDSNIASRYVSP
jgi:hypothetical protein